MCCVNKRYTPPWNKENVFTVIPMVVTRMIKKEAHKDVHPCSKVVTGIPNDTAADLFRGEKGIGMKMKDTRRRAGKKGEGVKRRRWRRTQKRRINEKGEAVGRQGTRRRKGLLFYTHTRFTILWKLFSETQTCKDQMQLLNINNLKTKTCSIRYTKGDLERCCSVSWSSSIA